MTPTVPAGDIHSPHIKRLSKNTDGTYTFIVYRNGRYIDCSNDLEEAKAIAVRGVMRPERILAAEAIRKYVKDTPRDAAAFTKLSKIGQQTIIDVYPHLVPRKSELEGKKGVKVARVNSNRGDLMSKNEKRAVANGLPMEAKIKLVDDKNPKKEGSDAHFRWNLLFQHDGKTVGAFIGQGGNPTTLKNAVKRGNVKVEGM